MRNIEVNYDAVMNCSVNAGYRQVLGLGFYFERETVRD